MSWSVNAVGTIDEVKAQLAEQFALPLAPAPKGVSDAGERETIHRVHETILQVLRTFVPDVQVHVYAHGYMGGVWRDGAIVAGRHQRVSLDIAPWGGE